MSKAPDHLEALLAAWHTNSRVTSYLIKNLPAELWSMNVPGSRRTVRSTAAHLHNSRCMWTRTIGSRHGVAVPTLVNIRTVQANTLLRALDQSSKGIADLLRLGVANGGHVPPAIWQNFPTDVVHLLSYFVAHEAHHRGQLVMLARQLGHKLPKELTAGLWQWNRRAKE